jgi:hypothetical protein
LKIIQSARSTAGRTKRDFLIPSKLAEKPEKRADNDTDLSLDSGPSFFYLLLTVGFLVTVGIMISTNVVSLDDDGCNDGLDGNNPRGSSRLG